MLLRCLRSIGSGPQSWFTQSRVYVCVFVSYFGGNGVVCVGSWRVVYTCVCIYINLCMYICIICNNYVYCMYIYICMCIYMYIMYICIYVYVCMYVCIYIYIYTHTHMYLCMCVCMNLVIGGWGMDRRVSPRVGRDLDICQSRAGSKLLNHSDQITNYYIIYTSY